MRAPLALALAIAIAGCVELAPPSGSPDGHAAAEGASPGATSSMPQEPSSSIRPSNPPASSGPVPAAGSGAPNNQSSGNASTPLPPAAYPIWGALESVPIHAGTVISTGTGGCTTNFVFTSADNRHIYIGTAAHCFGLNYTTGEDAPYGCEQPPRLLQIGSPVHFISDNFTYQAYYGSTSPDFSQYVSSINGTLAYSSWITMSALNETWGTNACRFNDFALVEIPREAAQAVSPCVPSLGCPSRIADASEVTLLSPAVCYCHSPDWLGQDPLIEKKGVVSQPPDDQTEHWWYLALYDTPIFYGDSGSLGMVGDHLAAGVLTYFGTNPGPANSVIPGPGDAGYTVLQTALAYMEAHTDLRVKLAEA